MGRSRPLIRRRPSASVVLLVCFLLLLAVRLLSPHEPAVDELVLDTRPHVVERVIDGDTLLLAGGYRIRLIGVDAPETKHPDRPIEPMGEAAAAFVSRCVDGRPVRLEFDRQRRDRYQRLLAYVWLSDGRLLNEELIIAGLGVAQTQYSYRQDMKRRFQRAEQDARAARRGRWSASPRATLETED